MNGATQRSEMAAFLRARRQSLQPEMVGLASGPRRRTPGLRREEVAACAGVGVTWYTWLEQGRDIRVSDVALSRIAGALRLSSSDRAYLLSLAGRSVETSLAQSFVAGANADAQKLLDGFTAGPAMLWNARFDCVAFNRLADLVYEWSGFDEPLWRNFVWRTFMDPARRAMYRETDELLRNGLGMLRARYATHVGEQSFEVLVDALRDGSDEFRQLWNEQHTASLDPVAAELNHPRLGILSILSIRALLPSMAEHTLLFVAPADGPTERVFRSI